VVGPETWNKIAEIYTDITASGLRQTEQAPGISLRLNEQGEGA